ncbi:MAG: F0F1 ATP synthase subunit A [Thermoleophilaceae bacterium]|nr:F0F1 ATP synthase subunit A [Thermoleophilaceae bacterium]
MKERFMALGTGKKVLLVFGLFVVVAVVVNMLVPSEGKNDAFKPETEFKLDPWVTLKLGPLDMSLNKAVLYLFLACALTTMAMLYIAKRMQDRPNRVQTAVEAAYDLARNQITGNNMDDSMALRWFPFIGTIFFFILFSNLIGYVPLPTNTEHTVEVFGIAFPTFAIYAATANLSIPLMLTLMVWFSYHREGIKAKGFVPYFKSWMPAGLEDMPLPARAGIFAIEVISQFVRIISLSVRLFANILAGHLLILFMGGGLVVLLGLAALGVFTLPIAILFFMFEVGLIAGLQAFIFATLTSIYLGAATAEGH